MNTTCWRKVWRRRDQRAQGRGHPSHWMASLQGPQCLELRPHSDIEKVICPSPGTWTHGTQTPLCRSESALRLTSWVRREADRASTRQRCYSLLRKTCVSLRSRLRRSWWFYFIINIGNGRLSEWEGCS